MPFFCFLTGVILEIEELVAKLSVSTSEDQGQEPRSEDQQGQNKEAGCLFGFKQIDDKIAFLINLFGV